MPCTTLLLLIALILFPAYMINGLDGYVVGGLITSTNKDFSKFCANWGCGRGAVKSGYDAFTAKIICKACEELPEDSEEFCSSAQHIPGYITIGKFSPEMMKSLEPHSFSRKIQFKNPLHGIVKLDDSPLELTRCTIKNLDAKSIKSAVNSSFRFYPFYTDVSVIVTFGNYGSSSPNIRVKLEYDPPPQHLTQSKEGGYMGRESSSDSLEKKIKSKEWHALGALGASNVNHLVKTVELPWTQNEIFMDNFYVLIQCKNLIWPCSFEKVHVCAQFVCSPSSQHQVDTLLDVYHQKASKMEENKKESAAAAAAAAAADDDKNGLDKQQSEASNGLSKDKKESQDKPENAANANTSSNGVSKFNHNKNHRNVLSMNGQRITRPWSGSEQNSVICGGLNHIAGVVVVVVISVLFAFTFE